MADEEDIFELSPAEVAAMDQINAEFRDHPPIPVPIAIVTRLVNRYRRLGDLEKKFGLDNVPGMIVNSVRESIMEALDELDAYAEATDVPFLYRPRQVKGDGGMEEHNSDAG